MKYSATKEGKMLRIWAERDIPMHDVNKGDQGGLIESVDCLSQDGECWVDNKAVVMTGSKVSEDALVADSTVHGKSVIMGRATVVESIIENASVVDDEAHIERSTLDGCSARGAAIVKDSTAIMTDFGDSADVRKSRLYNTYVCGDAQITKACVKDMAITGAATIGRPDADEDDNIITITSMHDYTTASASGVHCTAYADDGRIQCNVRYEMGADDSAAETVTEACIRLFRDVRKLHEAIGAGGVSTASPLRKSQVAQRVVK